MAYCNLVFACYLSALWQLDKDLSDKWLCWEKSFFISKSWHIFTGFIFSKFIGENPPWLVTNLWFPCHFGNVERSLSAASSEVTFWVSSYKTSNALILQQRMDTAVNSILHQLLYRVVSDIFRTAVQLILQWERSLLQKHSITITDEN